MLFRRGSLGSGSILASSCQKHRKVFCGDVPPELLPLAATFDQEKLLDALFNHDFSTSAEVANAMVVLAYEAGEVTYAWEASITALDSAFRAVGLEPASSDAPFFQLGPGGAFRLTGAGHDALLVLDPESEALNDPDWLLPIHLTEDGIRSVQNFEKPFAAALHPDQ